MLKHSSFLVLRHIGSKKPKISIPSVFLPSTSFKIKNNSRLMSKGLKYYAVAAGRKTGIFFSWEQCKEQIDGFKGANFKSFTTLEEAQRYILAGTVQDQTMTSSLSSSITICGNESQRKRGREIPPIEVESSTSVGQSVPEDGNVIEVYVDGACQMNGKGKSASAGYGGYYGPNDSRNFSFPLVEGTTSTNNRAELMALLYVLETNLQIQRDANLKSKRNQEDIKAATFCPQLRVYSDSRYVISGLTQYSSRWVKNNFTLTNKRPVKNRDLWEKIITLRDAYNQLYFESRLILREDSSSSPPISTEKDTKEGKSLSTEGIVLIHVKGHKGIVGNELADRLAVAGAQKHRLLKIESALNLAGDDHEKMST